MEQSNDKKDGVGVMDVAALGMILYVLYSLGKYIWFLLRADRGPEKNTLGHNLLKFAKQFIIGWLGIFCFVIVLAILFVLPLTIDVILIAIVGYLGYNAYIKSKLAKVEQANEFRDDMDWYTSYAFNTYGWVSMDEQHKILTWIIQKFSLSDFRYSLDDIQRLAIANSFLDVKIVSWLDDLSPEEYCNRKEVLNSRWEAKRQAQREEQLRINSLDKAIRKQKAAMNVVQKLPKADSTKDARES